MDNCKGWKSRLQRLNQEAREARQAVTGKAATSLPQKLQTHTSGRAALQQVSSREKRSFHFIPPSRGEKPRRGEKTLPLNELTTLIL